jgi:hypothetical protein
VLAFRFLRSENRNRATATEARRQSQTDQGPTPANDSEYRDSAVLNRSTSIWSDAL